MMYKLNYDSITGKVCSVNKGDNLSINISIPSGELEDFFKWNKAQKTPLDLNSTISVVPLILPRDLAKEIDLIKVDVVKLKEGKIDKV